MIDFTGYEEKDRGSTGVGQTIVHVTLALLFLGGVYAFFFKTEWIRPRIDTRSTEFGVLYTNERNL